MRPAFRITADGADATAALADRLLALTLSDAAGIEADELLIRLDDRDQRIALPAPGARLDVALGWDGQALTEMGSFTVSGLSLSGPDRALEIKAVAADLTGAVRAPRTRAWDGQTLAAIAGQIATRHGLAPVVAADIAGHVWTHQAQTAESDLHFLTRIAAELGALAKIAAGRLVLARSGLGRFPDGTAIPSARLTAPEIGTWRWREGERSAYAAAKAWWQDTAGGQRREVTAGGGEPVFELREVWPSEAAAIRAATARLAELNRGKRALSATLPVARLDLAAELPVTVAGLRAGVDGPWVLTRVDHSLSDAGLTTSIEAEPPLTEDAP